jgi:hypothetical protein
LVPSGLHKFELRRGELLAGVADEDDRFRHRNRRRRHRTVCGSKTADARCVDKHQSTTEQAARQADLDGVHAALVIADLLDRVAGDVFERNQLTTNVHCLIAFFTKHGHRRRLR